MWSRSLRFARRAASRSRSILNGVIAGEIERITAEIHGGNDSGWRTYSRKESFPGQFAQAAGSSM